MKLKINPQAKNKVVLLIGLIFILTVSSCVSPHYRQDKSHEPPGKFEPIPIERANGIFATIGYSPSSDYTDIELETEPAITPGDIKEIRKSFLYSGTYAKIELELTQEGARKFHMLTKENIGKPIAIVVDNQKVGMPMVMAAIVEGRVSIAGGYAEDEIDRLIKILKEEISQQ